MTAKLICSDKALLRDLTRDYRTKVPNLLEDSSNKRQSDSSSEDEDQLNRRLSQYQANVH